MSKEPWFKFWAADYLTDPDVQKLPFEAQGLLLRMWCACHIDGSIPAEPEELSVLIRSKLHSVLLSYPLCKPFFELHDGMLFSPRMEREKKKSEQARVNAEAKKNKGTYAIGSANGSANGSAKTPAQNVRRPEGQKEVQDQKKNLVAKATVDSRFVPFIDDLNKYWHQLPGHEEKKLPMDSAAGKNLKKWLKDNPQIDEPMWWNWLENMFSSEDINPAWNIREILQRIHRYQDGPLNVFGKPMEIAHGARAK
jgi:hypothetical protein